MASTTLEFSGTARFAPRRTLGSGGMGVVYHVYDRAKGCDVALKTLRFLDPEAIYRLKREFRSLADVSHPNLVSLYELVSEGDQWFFVMELVRGATFLDHVRGAGGFAPPPDTLDIGANTVRLQGPIDDPNDDTTLAERREPTQNTEVSVSLALRREILDLHASSGQVTHSGNTQRPGGPTPFAVADTWRDVRERPNIVRLRSALKQLVQGVMALHAAGKLHRDLKPSNVLVTPSGRVVILDFGLVTELFPDVNQSATEHGFSGTVPYMAPEQGSAEGRAPPVDWYSVGVMLYEALTGRLPFPGTGIDVLLRKQREDPPRPSSFAANIPPDLELLAMQLLDRDPHKRPTGDSILERLGSPPRRRPSMATGVVRAHGSAVGDPAAPFVGRHRYLDALDSAYAATREGHPVAVFVRGASGIGKTALVRSFLDELRTREGAVIFAGRCYERESVPFKAVDSLIDAVSRYLDKLTFQEIEGLLPRTIRALARVFPVLLRVEAIQRSPRLAAETPDPHELRRRAFRAAAELLTRMSERHPVVLFIDDLQWGDADSAALILDLLKPPDAPPILFVACHRSDEESNSPILRDTLAKSRAEGADVRVLTVGGLTLEEGRDFAMTLLGEHADEARAIHIAREADGNPFFIEALVRHQRRQPRPGSEHTPAEPVSLDRVMQVRLARLGRAARTLLEVIATAGHPLPVEVALEAAETSPDEAGPTLGALKGAGFVRATPSPAGELVETFHDRVRESVTSQLSPELLVERHHAIARALEHHPHEGPGMAEAVYHHYRAAGMVAEAARHAYVAGQHAADMLAFDRAARLFAIALEHTRDREERRVRMAALGDALVNAGRGAEAAEAYLGAVDESQPLASTNLRRLAAEQLLVSGHVDRGLTLLREVLAGVDLKLAKTPRRAYFSRVLRRGALWRRGFEFTERRADQVPPAELMRIDILWSTVLGLVMIDFIRGADFQSRHIMYALDAGEPYRIARALALEACYVATGGGRGQWRTARLVEEATALARAIDHPHALGLASFAEGAAAYFEGHWARARILLERAEEIFRDRCTGVHWESMATRVLLHGALYHLGQIAVLARRLPHLVDDAELRGDLFAGTVYRVGYATSVWLAADNPERALRNLEEAIEQWSQQGYYVQHCLALLGRTTVLLYAARADEAHTLLENEWPKLEQHYFLKLQYLRVEAIYLRGLAALGTAHAGHKKKAALHSLAERCAKDLEDEKMKWTAPLAAMVRAGVAEHRGQAELAVRHYREAVQGFQAAGMTMREAAARLRLGELLGGDQGRGLVGEALARMNEQNVRNPIRFSLALAPISSKY